MSEVRTTSSTGGQKGMKPERYDLLPKVGLDAVARVYGFGASKYADHNWRRGYEWSKSIAAAMRHLTAFADGETYDAESGEPHAAHAAFHLLALLTWLEEQGEGADNPFDDRWPAGMERARREKEAAAAEVPFPDPPAGGWLGPHVELADRVAKFDQFADPARQHVERIKSYLDRLTEEKLAEYAARRL